MNGQVTIPAVQRTTNNETEPESTPILREILWSPDVSQLQWPELIKTSEYINIQTWKQSRMPAEVTQLPENVIIPEKLNEILKWSTWRDADFPRRAPSARAFGRQNQPSRSASTVGTSNVSAPTSDLRRSESIRHALQNPTPQSDRLLSRLKNLRKAMRDPLGLLKDWEKPNLPSQAAETSDPESEQEPEPQVGECISCFDEFPKSDLVHPPCNHEYCKNCLKEVITNTMKNESAFPPKCCLTEIPLKTILFCLDSKLREEYKEKAAEYSIGAGHRWYCPNTACTKWIRPEHLHRNRRAVQVCPHCKTKICSHCRATAHGENQDCPQDFGLEATLEIAESEGWRRCYSCRTMVELTTGCRHITCKCGAEFCYVCNARWRTCACTEEDKNRRLEELRSKRAQTDQQRREEDEAAAAEAEEIARAIAQVEEMEMREAQEREEEERRRQREEEEILIRLESLRLEEERQKQVAIEEAEREYEQVLMVSCKEQCEGIKDTLELVTRYQHSTLCSKHEASERFTVRRCSRRDAEIAAYSERVSSELAQNIKNRRARMEARESKRMTELNNQLEEEEDAMFMQIQLHLRDKPNREAREKRMRYAFDQEQSGKREKLQSEQDQVRNKFQMFLEFEVEGINRAIGNMLQKADTASKIEMSRFGALVGAERQWLEFVAARRMRMVEANEKTMFEQLEAGEEPVGLTIEQAQDIEPFLPDVDEGGPGPSGSRQHVHSQSPQARKVLTTIHAQPEPTESADMYGADANAETILGSDNSKPAQRTVNVPACFVTPPQPTIPMAQPLTPPDSATPVSSASSVVNYFPGSYPLSPRDSRDMSRDMSPPRADNVTPRNEPRVSISSADNEHCQAPGWPLSGSSHIPMPAHAPPVVPKEVSHRLPPHDFSVPARAPLAMPVPMPLSAPPPIPDSRQLVPQPLVPQRKALPLSPQETAAAAARGAINKTTTDVSITTPTGERSGSFSNVASATPTHGRRKSSLFGLFPSGKPKEESMDEYVRQKMRDMAGDAT